MHPADHPERETGGWPRPKFMCCKGRLSKADIAKIKHYCINPVEAREQQVGAAQDVGRNFNRTGRRSPDGGIFKADQATSGSFTATTGTGYERGRFALVPDFILKITAGTVDYRIGVLDTYWSDHCRHTTFMTCLDKVEIADGPFNMLLFRRLCQSIRLTGISCAGKIPRVPHDF